MSEFSKTCEEKIKKVLVSLADDFSKVRSGRASTAVLDDVKVESYGQMQGISSVATISNPEARLLVISPWDKSLISEIEKAILKANIGITPSNDGKVIRLAFPALSKERRQESVKMCKTIAEKHKVSIRNLRRDAMDEVKKAEKDGLISESEKKKEEDKIQKIVDTNIASIDSMLEKKSAEILEI